MRAAGAKDSEMRSEAQYTQMQYEREFVDDQAWSQAEGLRAAPTPPWLRRAAVPEEALVGNNHTTSLSSDSLQRHCSPLLTKVGASFPRPSHGSLRACSHWASRS